MAYNEDKKSCWYTRSNKLRVSCVTATFRLIEHTKWVRRRAEVRRLSLLHRCRHASLLWSSKTDLSFMRNAKQERRGVYSRDRAKSSTFFFAISYITPRALSVRLELPDGNLIFLRCDVRWRLYFFVLVYCCWPIVAVDSSIRWKSRRNPSQLSLSKVASSRRVDHRAQHDVLLFHSSSDFLNTEKKRKSCTRKHATTKERVELTVRNYACEHFSRLSAVAFFNWKTTHEKLMHRATEHIPISK